LLKQQGGIELDIRFKGAVRLMAPENRDGGFFHGLSQFNAGFSTLMLKRFNVLQGVFKASARGSRTR
jgi:hypothetical protein